MSSGLKTAAIIFGSILALVGILGFFPQAKVGDNLFGLFRVNDVHNWIHILSGVVAIICGFVSGYASKMYFRVFGIIYALVALLGVFHGHGDILGVVANNVHDEWLHALIAAVALYLGFGCCCHHCGPRPPHDTHRGERDENRRDL